MPGGLFNSSDGNKSTMHPGENNSFWIYFMELVRDLSEKTSVIKPEYLSAMQIFINDFTVNPKNRDHQTSREAGSSYPVPGEPYAPRLFHGDAGWIHSGKEEQKVISAINKAKQPAVRRGSLPVKYSLRKEGWISAPKLQGFSNSCTAFAVIAALEAYKQLQSGKKYNLSPYRFSEQFLFFHSIPTKTDTDPPEDLGIEDIEKEIARRITNGWSVVEGLAFCEETGYVKEASLAYNPYNRFTMPPFTRKINCRIDKIPDWSFYAWHKDDLTEWKEHLYSNNGGLIISFPFSPDFFLYKKDEIYRYSEEYIQPEGSGHAVLCVGYDDNRQAWECKNSWGTEWGDAGFFWLDYRYPLLKPKAYYICGKEDASPVSNDG